MEKELVRQWLDASGLDEIFDLANKDLAAALVAKATAWRDKTESVLLAEKQQKEELVSLTNQRLQEVEALLDSLKK